MANLSRPPFREWRLKHRIKIAKRRMDQAELAKLYWQLLKVKAAPQKAGQQ